MAKDREGAAAPPTGGNPPADQSAPAREVVKTKPWKREQHAEAAKSLGAMATQLEAMQKKVACYAPSSEVRRATREAVVGFNRMRMALNSRFFSEGHSADGTTVYFTKDIPVLKPEDD